MEVWPRNLPSLSRKQAEKLRPGGASCHLLAPLTPATHQPKWDQRYNAKAAHLLMEYAGGDLYLMRTVVEGEPGSKLSYARPATSPRTSSLPTHRVSTFPSPITQTHTHTRASPEPISNPMVMALGLAASSSLSKMPKSISKNQRRL